jgi:hypothetical protein
MPSSTTELTPPARLRASRAHKPSSATGTSPGNQRGAVRRTRSHRPQDKKSVTECVRNTRDNRTTTDSPAGPPNRCHHSAIDPPRSQRRVTSCAAGSPSDRMRPPMTKASATEMAARRLPRSDAVQTTLHTTRPTHRTAAIWPCEDPAFIADGSRREVAGMDRPRRRVVTGRRRQKYRCRRRQEPRYQTIVEPL